MIIICCVATARRYLFLIFSPMLRSARKIEFNENRCAQNSERWGVLRFRSNFALACAVGILTGRARILGAFLRLFASGYVPPHVHWGCLILAMRKTCPRGRGHAGVNAISTRSSSLKDEPIVVGHASVRITLNRTILPLT